MMKIKLCLLKLLEVIHRGSEIELCSTMSGGGWNFWALEYFLTVRVCLNETINRELFTYLNHATSITSAAAELAGDFTLPLRPEPTLSRLNCTKDLSKGHGDSVTVTNKLVYYLLRSVLALLQDVHDHFLVSLLVLLHQHVDLKAFGP